MTEINLNEVGCIKPISNIGHTIYRNICTGVDHVTPWGSVDWFSATMMAAVIAIIAAGLVLAAWFFYNEFKQ